MYEKAIVMYAKQVDYFWYELSTFVHKLRLDVQTLHFTITFRVEYSRPSHSSF